MYCNTHATVLIHQVMLFLSAASRLDASFGAAPPFATCPPGKKCPILQWLEISIKTCLRKQRSFLHCYIEVSSLDSVATVCCWSIYSVVYCPSVSPVQETSEWVEFYPPNHLSSLPPTTLTSSAFQNRPPALSSDNRPRCSWRPELKAIRRAMRWFSSRSQWWKASKSCSTLHILHISKKKSKPRRSGKKPQKGLALTSRCIAIPGSGQVSASELRKSMDFLR